MKTYSRRRGVNSAFQINKEDLSKLQDLVLNSMTAMSLKKL